jgi:hypothetical protein
MISSKAASKTESLFCKATLRRVQISNLGFEFLVVSPQLLDQLPRAGNIEVSDIEAD